MIVNILNSIKLKFDSIDPRTLSNQLDNIGIIPICLPEDMLSRGFGKERKYVSLKKRTADIRLRIPYETFMSCNFENQISLCRENLISAAKYIAKKDRSFNIDRFLSLIESGAGGNLCESDE